MPVGGGRFGRIDHALPCKRSSSSLRMSREIILLGQADSESAQTVSEVSAAGKRQF
jgi:hypothetical protein